MRKKGTALLLSLLMTFSVLAGALPVYAQGTDKTDGNLDNSALMLQNDAKAPGAGVAGAGLELFGDIPQIHKMDDMVARVHTDDGLTGQLRYRLYVPADYDHSKEYPVMIYLNGAGSRGTDNAQQLVNLGPLITPLIDNAEYPTLIVVPQLAPGEQWVNTSGFYHTSYSMDAIPESNAMKLLASLVDSLQEEFSVDGDRLYLMGQSMGGYGTWDAIVRYPDVFAAAIPMCGAGDPTKAAAIEIPLMVLHGSADVNVPVGGSRNMVSALETAGNENVHYLEYNDVDHYIQRRLFEQPDLWIPWLFSQSRGSEAVTADHSGIYQLTGHFSMFNGSLPSTWTYNVSGKTGTHSIVSDRLSFNTNGNQEWLSVYNETLPTNGVMISGYYTNTASQGGGGPVFQYIDATNYLHARITSNGAVELVVMNNGAGSIAASATGLNIPQGRIMTLSVALEGIQAIVCLDGVELFRYDMPAKFQLESARVGMRWYNGQGNLDDFFFLQREIIEVETPLRMTDMKDRQVVQRDPATESASVDFAARVLTADVERVQFRVADYASGAEVVGWTDAAIEDLNATASLNVPQGGWYRVEARALGAADAVLEAYEGSARWGVGINILCIGQSNMVGIGDAPYVVADDRVSNFKNEIWAHLVDPYAAGDTSVAGGNGGGSMTPTIGNILVEKYGVPVGFIPAALDGANLFKNNSAYGGNHWLNRIAADPTARSTIYGNSLYRAQEAGGIEFIIMNQGENNVSTYVDGDGALYAAAMQQLLSNYHNDLGYEVPIIYCQLGRAKANTSNVWTEETHGPAIDAIRIAQMDVDNGRTLLMGVTEMDLTLKSDNLHYTTPSQAIIGARMANAIQYLLGDASYYTGPSVDTVAFTGGETTQIEVGIRHTGGDDFSPEAGITGFVVIKADGTEVAISSAAKKDRNTILITLAEAAGEGAKLRYMQGLMPDVTGIVKDNSPLSLPLNITNGWVEVAGAPIVLPVDAETPEILQQPQGGQVTEGESYIFTVAVKEPTDGGTLSYQWYTGPQSDGTAINGANTASYTTPDDLAPGEYTYYVVVTNTNPDATGETVASVTSETATLVVNRAETPEPVDAQRPVIAVQPQGAEIEEGESHTFTVAADEPADGGTLSYQWYDAAGEIEGATEVSYTTPDTLPPGSYTYYVVVTNTNPDATGETTASVTSETATLVVNRAETPEPVDTQTPVITQQPKGAKIKAGESHTLSVSVAQPTDGGTLSYQWYTASGSAGSAIQGANSASLAVSNLTPGTYNYYVVVTNTNNAATGEATASTTSDLAVLVVEKIDESTSILRPEPGPTPTVIKGLPSEIRVGESFTLVPENDNRKGSDGWHWDEEYFTATFNSPATFTALKSGETVIRYTNSNGLVTTLTVVIEEASATSSVTTGASQRADTVATGDHRTLSLWLLILTGALSLIMLMHYRKKHLQ